MEFDGRWNSKVFALVGAVLGTAYGFFVAQIVGLVSFANLTLMILTLLFGAGLGALLVGGVAASRNVIGDVFERLAGRSARVRKTKNAPAAIKAKPRAVFQLNDSPR